MDPFAFPDPGLASGLDLGELLGGSPIGVLILDESYGILYNNSRIAEILGVEGGRLAEAVMAILNGPIVAQGLDIRDMAVDTTRPDGETRTLQLSFGTVAHGMYDAMIV